MRKETTAETIEEIRHKFLRLYKAEWIVWPTAQVINFWILPNKYRVLYDNTISLGYDVYTSYVINEPIPSPTSQERDNLRAISPPQDLHFKSKQVIQS